MAKTQRQIEKESSKKLREEYVTILNCSKQLITIHLKAPKGVDNFFLGAQGIYLHPGKKASFPKSRLMLDEQIANLQKNGIIKVLS